MSTADFEVGPPVLAPAFGRNIRRQASSTHRRRIRSRTLRADATKPHGSAPPSLSATVTTFPPTSDAKTQRLEVWSADACKVGRSASCSSPQQGGKRASRVGCAGGEYFEQAGALERRGSADSVRDGAYKVARVGAWATPQLRLQLGELRQMCGLGKDCAGDGPRGMARLARRLDGGLNIGTESPTDAPCGFSADSTVSTFDSELTAVEQEAQSPKANDKARDSRASEGMRSAMAKRLRRRPGVGAARRNVTLTIPTARVPLVAPGMFAIPALSPACTALNSETVSASCGSGVASPVPFDVGDMQQHTAPASTSARDMLSRLVGGHAGPEVHADAREAWGLFISECLKRVGDRGVLVAESPKRASDSGDAVVPLKPALPQRWFAGLVGGAAARMRGLVAHGVPAEFRRQVWMECSGALDVEPQVVGARARREEIELDMQRAEIEPGVQHEEIEHVLYGFVAANPGIGYCQGMDKIARGLLRAGLGAEDALDMLRAVVGRVLPADMFCPPMLGLQADQLVLQELVARRLPRLAAHLHAINAPLAPVTVAWFLALFVDCLPDAHRLRVWDMLFVRGYPAMFHASLGVLELCQAALLRCATPPAVYTLLQRVHDVVGDCVDADEFGCRVFGAPGVGADEISAIRRQVWPE
ncbi:hypothetical protein GGF43_004878 [Coemansia sp. RSA 2618]|nr:hypothetical protein GGF43_004878 [Coemansia sp. RSA 2618]